MTALDLDRTKPLAGNFVHENQTMSKDVDFKCVSRLWYDKTISLSDGLDKIAVDAAIRHDMMVSANSFRVESVNGETVLSLDGKTFRPTEYAWNQLAAPAVCNIGTSIVKALREPIKYGKKETPRDYKDAGLLADCFMNGHRRLDPKKVFRFRVDTNGVCRAILTEDYAPIPNTWYLETLQSIFKTIGGTEPRLSHWKGNADTVYGNLLIPDSCIENTDSDYGGMVSMSNCEIGKRRLEQYPSIFRAICQNGCIWNEVKGNQISKVHRGQINLTDIKERIFKNINESIPLLPTIVAQFLATKDFKLGNVTPANFIAQVSKDYKLTPKQAAEVAKQFNDFEAGDRNLFGIVNAITRAGQVYDNDTWVAFDVIGGELAGLNEKSFNNLRDRAALMNEKDVKAVFGISA